MEFTKQKLCSLDHCYATAMVHIDNKRHFLLAAENNGPCYAFEEETLARSTVWDSPGGTMSMVPVPGANGDFLAVQNFRSGFEAQDTTLVWARPSENGWIVETILKLPYIHRFDIISVGSVHYLLFCTLATSKKNKEDWSDPGKLIVAPLPKNLSDPIQLTVIKEGLTKNHGYVRIAHNKSMSAMVAAEEGVFLVTPPSVPSAKWTVEQILNRPVSDMAVTDIDLDGELEIATIESFHGNRFVLNKKINGQYREIYQYSGDFEFGHVVWGGTLCGRPAFLGGARRGARELFALVYDEKTSKIDCTIIESGSGPSNVAVFPGRKDGTDIILCANREIGEAALYIACEN